MSPPTTSQQPLLQQASTSTAPPPSAPPPVARPEPAPAAAPPRPLAAVSQSPIIPTITKPDGIKVVPHAFELCQVDDLIVLISSMLDRLITHNDRIPLTPTALTRFHSRAPPSITVCDYLSRIARYTNVEAAVLLVLLPYVDQVCSRWTTFTISSLSVHRFLIAGVSVGSKALSDSFCTNGRYARVGGISVAEMNLLEKEFCDAIDWRLTIKGPLLAHYYSSLVEQHPRYELAPNPNPPPVTSPTSPSSSWPPLSAGPDISVGASPSSSSSSSFSTRSPEQQSSPSNAATRPPSSPSEMLRGRRSPSLIPPRTLRTRLATASHLPSPVRPPLNGNRTNSAEGLRGPGRGSLDRMEAKLREVINRRRDEDEMDEDADEEEDEEGDSMDVGGQES